MSYDVYMCRAFPEKFTPLQYFIGKSTRGIDGGKMEIELSNFYEEYRISIFHKNKIVTGFELVRRADGKVFTVGSLPAM